MLSGFPISSLSDHHKFVLKWSLCFSLDAYPCHREHHIDTSLCLLAKEISLVGLFNTWSNTIIVYIISSQLIIQNWHFHNVISQSMELHRPYSLANNLYLLLINPLLSYVTKCFCFCIAIQLTEINIITYYKQFKSSF